MEKTDSSAYEHTDYLPNTNVNDQKETAIGTVNLVSEHAKNKKDVVLIPAPSADPRDPLNLPTWRKWVFAVILSIYSCTGLTAVSAAGALIGFFLQDYIAAGKGYEDIVHLITLPTLAMGVGNFLFMPIALAVGRRPVYLFSGALLVIGCLIAANNTNYEYHLAARMIIGFAAGQSEALVPLMLKEAFFLHERANILTFQSSFQGAVGCVLSIVASNIAAGIGWKNWYYVYAGLATLVFLLAIPFVPETKYERPLEAYRGVTATTPTAPRAVHESKDIESDGASTPQQAVQWTVYNRPALDTTRFAPRTLMSDLHPCPAKVDWSEGLLCLKHIVQIGWFPNIVLIILMNSIFLGINIAMGTTYATPLAAPPYNWAPKWLGVGNAGQIVVAFIALPFLGFGSDKLIKSRARKNGGIHEPEARLLTLGLPIVIGIISCVIFGYAYDHPYQFHWFALIFGMTGQYFSFIAANIAGQTYLLDAYPTRAGSLLVLICGCRGLISFGLTYSLTATTDALGHVGAYGMYAGLTTALGLGGLALYFFGKRLRLWTARFVIDSHDLSKPHYG